MKWDFSPAKQRVSMEMQPYVITVDDSFVSTATMPTAAVVPEGGGKDGYRMVLQSVARSTQPCIGIHVAGDSLAPMAGGQRGSRESLVAFAAWPNSDNLGVVFIYWNGSEYLQNFQLQLLINLAGVFSVSYGWVLSFGVNKLENSAT